MYFLGSGSTYSNSVFVLGQCKGYQESGLELDGKRLERSAAYKTFSHCWIELIEKLLNCVTFDK